jgi:hypothetical protein
MLIERSDSRHWHQGPIFGYRRGKTAITVNVAHSSWAIDELLLAFLRRNEQPHLGGRTLRQYFPKLSRLEQRDRRVVYEVLFGLRREGDKARVVVREVSEVGRGLRTHNATS